MKKTAWEQWEAIPDLATPKERRWIDEWGGSWQRPGKAGRYKITSRHGPKDGEFRSLRVYLHGAKWVLCQGVIGITLKQIKADVLRYRASEKRKRIKEAERMVGAFI